MNKWRCIFVVESRQCKRSRGHGPGHQYCKQHAKIIDSQRVKKMLPSLWKIVDEHMEMLKELK